MPYVGLPGNPVSSMVSFNRFARPAILKMLGHQTFEHISMTATLTEPLDSDGRESYIRVVLEQVGMDWHATPTGGQGSHMISSLVKANGFLIIPEGVKQVEAGERLKALLLDT